MVSMKDISAACGVSIATVSKALNGHSDVSAETKQSIRQKAREMGYYPNAQARALKTNRSYNIGVLFVDEARSGLTHDYFVGVLDSFKRTVEDKGYDITFINSSRSRMSYLEHCRSRRFDGVVIACVDFRHPQVLELVHSDIPVVTIDHLFHNRTAVMSDNVKGMAELFAYVYARGHRRIAYIHGADSSVTQSRLSSFYKMAEELGVEIPDAYVLEAAYRDTGLAAAATARLLELSVPPTCIIYPDDFACFGGINEIRRRGLKIPDDISVAGYDGIRAGRHIEPRLTTLGQDTEQLGREAGRKLVAMIERPKSAVAEQIIVSGKIVEGETVSCL